MSALGRLNRPLADYLAYGRGVWALTVAQVGIGLDRIPVSAAVLGVSIAPLPSAATCPGNSELSRASRVARRLAAAFGERNYCLRHSLVLGHLLRAHEPTLRFGVRRGTGTVEAHAWIEVGGVALARNSASEGTEFVRLGRMS